MAQPMIARSKLLQINAKCAAMKTDADHVNLTAFVDECFHEEETPVEWNLRLRDNIKTCFNKIFLEPKDIVLFEEWGAKVDAAAAAAAATAFLTREQLFNLAPINCLHIIGI